MQKPDLQMKEITMNGVMLKNTEMSTVKYMKMDIITETMKMAIITTVASHLATVEEVVINENTRVIIVPHIIMHRWYE